MRYTTGTWTRIDRIFGNALNEGRSTLYEFEMYAALKELGLPAPKYEFVRRPEEVDDELLRPFAGGAIIKVVSADIAHKSKIGGVKKIEVMDPLFVRYALNAMRDEVLQKCEKGARIDGFLIAEFIPFAQSLGSEILIGAREDPAFGPVVTVSKGGDDAEFFAKYYDPAVLMLSPLELDDALRIVMRTKIRRKYEDAGKFGYSELIADAIYKISEFASHYSFVSGHEQKFHITEMDMNPFVFAKDGRFVCVDGFAKFVPAAQHTYEVARGVSVAGIDKFFEPHGIVVAGVSTQPGKNAIGSSVALLLNDLKRNDLYCVNPKGGQALVGGTMYPLYKSLADVPAPYDLVVYAAPAQYSLDFIKGVPENSAVILISGIPSDMKYSDFMRELNAVKPRGVRIVGPNCMGVYATPTGAGSGVNTLFIGEEKLRIRHDPRANTALFSQSGAMAISSIERAGAAPAFRNICSFGNKADVGIPDLTAYFGAQRDIDVLAMYIEGIDPGEGRELFSVMRGVDKPMIIYKSGRTEAGARAAASHTASMTGSYEVFKAACSQVPRAVLAEDVNQFYCLSKAFSLLIGKRVRGKRVAGVANAGFDSTMGADSIGYMTQATLSRETIARLDEINTHGLVDTATSFLDVTPMTDDVMYAAFIEALLKDENVDCLFIGVVPHIENLKTTPERFMDEDALAPLIAGLVKRYDKPITMSVNAGTYYEGFVEYLEKSGVAVYSEMRSAMFALESYVKYALGDA